MELKWHKEGEVQVVRSSEMERLRTFFEGFGLRFAEEKHASGPVHFAAQAVSRVFEIYLQRLFGLPPPAGSLGGIGSSRDDSPGGHVAAVPTYGVR